MPCRHRIQIICLSATLPTLDELGGWLSAEKYETHFRPVELNELIICGAELRDVYTMKFVRSMPTEFAIPNDIENIIGYAFRNLITLTGGDSLAAITVSLSE